MKNERVERPDEGPATATEGPQGGAPELARYSETGGRTAHLKRHYHRRDRIPRGGQGRLTLDQAFEQPKTLPRRQLALGAFVIIALASTAYVYLQRIDVQDELV